MNEVLNGQWRPLMFGEGCLKSTPPPCQPLPHLYLAPAAHLQRCPSSACHNDTVGSDDNCHYRRSSINWSMSLGTSPLFFLMPQFSVFECRVSPDLGEVEAGPGEGGNAVHCHQLAAEACKSSGCSWGPQPGCIFLFAANLSLTESPH